MMSTIVRILRGRSMHPPANFQRQPWGSPAGYIKTTGSRPRRPIREGPGIEEGLI